MPAPACDFIGDKLVARIIRTPAGRKGYIRRGGKWFPWGLFALINYVRENRAVLIEGELTAEDIARHDAARLLSEELRTNRRRRRRSF